MSDTTLYFEFLDGNAVVRTESLNREVIKVGSLSSSHLQVEDESVSRMHAVIEASSDGVHIIDLGSNSGTMVNGVKVNKSELHHGDKLQVGSVLMVVGIGSPGHQGVASEQTAVSSAAYQGSPSAPPAPSAAAASRRPAPPPSPSARPAPPRPPVPGAMPPPSAMGSPSGAPAVSQRPMTSLMPLNPSDVESHEDAVEVKVFWGDGSALAVDHLSPTRSYYVGDETDAKGNPTTDYLIASEAIGTSRMPVVLESGSGVSVVVPEGASGFVEMPSSDPYRQAGSMVPIQTQQGQPCSEMAGAMQYPLPKGATARVQYNGFTFEVSPVNAGRVVGNVSSYDPVPLFYIGGVAAFGILMMLIFYYLAPPSSALNLGLLDKDSLLVDYMMDAEEMMEEETPEWLDSNQNDTEGGQGKRHKGDEGQMGKEESKKTNNRYAIEGPQDNEDLHMAREHAKEQAKTAGILGTLAQMTGSFNSPTSPFGRDTALGNDPMSAMGALMGDQIGDNFGFGGLGLRGTGRGGGGTGEGTIGLGNMGTIGHGAGGGTGSGYGRGAGGFSGRSSKVPKIRSGTADVRGSLSKEVIRRVVRRHINEVKFCYERELNTRPDLAGRVAIKFIISATGAVQSANVANSSLGNANVEQCVAQAVRRWAFPAPDGGGIVVVTYPFMLSPPG